VGTNGRDDEDLDLTNLPPVTSHPSQRGLPPVPTDPTDQRLLVQEMVRAGLAIALFLLLLVVIILGFLSSRPFDQTRELFEISVPVLVALLGTAMTFYYIDRDRK